MASGDSASAAAEIARGWARGMQQNNAKQLVAELNAREQLAKKLEEIEKDNGYDPDARDKARNFAIALRMLPPTDKRPKEFEPDPKLAKQLGLSDFEAIPALVQVTLKKRMKDGPKEPPQPAEPADPSASFNAPPAAGGAMPPVPSMPGMPTLEAPPSMPPMPGGQQLGPNQVTAAPAVPSAPAGSMGGTVGSAPSSGVLPPPPELPEYISTRRTPEEIALEEGRLAAAKRELPIDPAIAKFLGLPVGTTSVDPAVLQNLRLTGDREARLIARGFDGEGNPLPWKQQLDLAKINLQNAQAEAQRALADGRPDAAAATLLRANAAMLSAQAAMERATNPAAGGGAGTFFPVVDEQGNIIGGVNNKTWATVGPPDINGARKTPAASGSLDRRAALDATLASLEELEQLGEANTDRIGPVIGRITDVQRNTIGADAGINDLFRISDDIADQLLRARSGAAITEGEYARLRKLVPDPRSPLEKFRSDLAGYRREALRLRALKADAGRQATKELPPVGERVAGKTKAVIGGVERVWNGTGWAKVKP